MGDGTLLDCLTRNGGVAGRAALVAAGSERALTAALVEGSVIRLARGRYALPTAAHARSAAHRVAGVAANRSAAAHWGWPMKWQPLKPSVVVPRGRNVPTALRRELDISWRPLASEDIADGWVTTPLRTVLDCAMTLPFDEALAIADSALRSESLTRKELLRAARGLPKRGRSRVTEVLVNASARAANPFESVLRAIAVRVPGLTVVPQVRIADRRGRFIGRVDLADTLLKVALEAEGFEFHGERELLERDCRRYDELVLRGWLVLRFSWEQVMKKQAWVRSVLERTVELRAGVPPRLFLPTTASG